MNAPDRGKIGTTRPKDGVLTGAKIISAVKAAGVRTVVAVPDIHTSKGLLFPIAQDKEMKLIRVCKEDECFGIAAGLSYSDTRTLIMIQYTGMLYAMNAIRAIACEHQMPMCFMIGLLAKEPDVAPRQSKKLGVSVMQPLLDVMAIAHHEIDTDADVGQITGLINDAYTAKHPVAMLIGRKPV